MTSYEKRTMQSVSWAWPGEFEYPFDRERYETKRLRDRITRVAHKL